MLGDKSGKYSELNGKSFPCQVIPVILDQKRVTWWFILFCYLSATNIVKHLHVIFNESGHLGKHIINILYLSIFSYIYILICGTALLPLRMILQMSTYSEGQVSI